MGSLTVTINDEVTQGGIACRRAVSSGSCDVLALVMGYGGGLRVWPVSFVEALAQDFVVITYDNRGTGRSFVPKEPEEYTIEKMACDLEQVIDHFQIAKLNVLGYSMGGCIALQYAHAFAAKVKSLFLLSSTAGGALFVKPAPEMSQQLANPPGKTLYDIYMSTFKLMYSPHVFARCQSALDSIYENAKDYSTTPTALRGHSHAFKSFDASNWVKQLDVPTVIMAGEDDRLMPVGNSKNLAEAIKNSHLVLLNDCEHAAHVQDEARVIEEIKRLCRS